MLDAVTLLFVTAIVVAFSGLLLSLAPGASTDSRTMRVWGASLLTGAMGLVVSAAGQEFASLGADLCGTALFLLASGTAWAGACRFAGRTVRRWWPFVPPLAWFALLLPVQSGSLRLALACWIGATTSTLAAAELWSGRTERLVSLPAVSVLMAVHALIYAARGAAALAGGVPPGWSGAVLDVMVLESLLHAMGVAFLVVALMKERADLRSHEELRTLALSDGLTGVANRRHFDLALSFEATRIRRARDGLGVVLLDVDLFKSYNDALGHLEGDACLRSVAAALRRAAVKSGGLVARYGGEEFAILLSSSSDGTVLQCGEAARLAVERLAIPHPLGGLVTVSAGVAVMPGTQSGAIGIQALLGTADRALYAAKYAGRNRVCSLDGHLPRVPAPVAAKPVAAVV